MTSHNSTPPGKYGEFFIWNHIKLKILGEDDKTLQAMYPNGEVALFARNDGGEWRRVSNLLEPAAPRSPECSRIKMQDQYHVNGDTWYDRTTKTMEVFDGVKWSVVPNGFRELAKHIKIGDVLKALDVAEYKKDSLLDYHYLALLGEGHAGRQMRSDIFGMDGVTLNVELIVEATKAGQEFYLEPKGQ